MRVRLTREFQCCPGGVVIETFAEGEVVTGFVAIAALRAGAGEEVKPVAFNPVEETKTKRRRK
jgi:hypothetical protein